MAKKASTQVMGYYNGAKWPIQIVFPKLNVSVTLQPGEFICDSAGRKINDPCLEAFVRRDGMLKREPSVTTVPICPVPRSASMT